MRVGSMHNARRMRFFAILPFAAALASFLFLASAPAASPSRPHERAVQDALQDVLIDQDLPAPSLDDLSKDLLGDLLGGDPCPCLPPAYNA